MKNKFAERLKELRTESEMSQTQLATILGVNQRTISNWEKEIRKPDFDMLMKIATTLDVSIDYLLGLCEYN